MLPWTVIFRRAFSSCLKLLTVTLVTWATLSAFFILSSIESPNSLQQQDNTALGLPEFKIMNMGDERNNYADDDAIHVCFTSDENTIIGAMAALNSVHKNTRRKVKFHIVVENSIVNHVRQWLSGSDLRGVDAEVIAFDTSLLQGKIKVWGGRTELAKPMNYARFLYPALLPGVVGRLVHLDDDVIVQGDIADLADIHMKPGQIAAFAEDCVSDSKRYIEYVNRYANFINLNNKQVMKLRLDPRACSFNTGVFMTYLGAWIPLNISQRLLYWTELNTKEHVYGNEKGGGGSQPPMMLVFYKQYATMDPVWHVRHLGSLMARKQPLGIEVKKAKLLHWNGPRKPWGASSQFQELWDKYFVPDPNDKYKPDRLTSNMHIVQDMPT